MILPKTVTFAKPFLKWAGGKSQLVPAIANHLPAELQSGKIQIYVEPFVGGGAVFFFMAQTYGEFFKEYCLYDANEDLVNCYNVIKNDVDSLIHELSKLAETYAGAVDKKSFYLEVRRDFNHSKHALSIRNAAELLFLNRTCFNGLYRVNRKNEFNVPFGEYKNPTICNRDNLQHCSKLLQKATIKCEDFSGSLRHAGPKSFFYFDPPYRPISKTASFTSYSKDSFSEEDQIRLAEFCLAVHKKHTKLLLSNSDPKNENPHDSFFESHFPDPPFKIDVAKASRAINCKAEGRGRINELLITNYEVNQ